MIFLYEHENEATKLLRHTLQQIHPIKCVCLYDNGFLDAAVTSPYQFFSDADNSIANPLYFNQLTIPDYWEISDVHNEALIKDMGEVRGKIIYKSYKQPRRIEAVEWYDLNQQVFLKSYYNKQGFKFKDEVFHHQRLTATKYYDAAGRQIIYKDNNMIELLYKDKKYVFNNDEAFFKFYLEHAALNKESIIFNSLSLPLKLTLEINHKHLLFWQEPIHDQVPVNMQYIMHARRNKKYQIVVPNHETYNRLLQLTDEDAKQIVHPFGYIYRYYAAIRNPKEILIATNSDNLEEINTIIESCESYQFHIAAPTQMSDKLTRLTRYKNVLLYPNVSNQQLKSLLKQTQVYLDINHGQEVLDILKYAYRYNLLLLSLERTAHQSDYMAKDNIFSDVTSLTEQMNNMLEDEALYKTRIKMQKDYANAWTKEKVKSQFDLLVDRLNGE